MNDQGRLFGRGIAFPPRVAASGRVAWSEGSDNIRESIRILLMTRAGERLFQPDLGAGLDRFLFEPNTVATHELIKDRVQRTLETWEPRIALESVVVEVDPADRESAIVTISYRLVATQARERLGLSVRLTG
jgi:phage baseplate assembly protein W